MTSRKIKAANQDVSHLNKDTSPKLEPLKPSIKPNDVRNLEASNQIHIPDNLWKDLLTLGTDFACLIEPDGTIVAYHNSLDAPDTNHTYIGSSIYDWTLASFHHRIQACFEVAMNSNDVISYEVISYLSHGDFVWLECKCKNVQAESGKMILIHGHNLTQYKQTTLSLQQSKNQYQMLCEQCSDMISHHDPAGRFLYVSGMCQSLTGYEPSELIGKNAMDFVHPEDRETIDEHRSSLVHSLGIRRVQYRVQHKNGHYIWVESQARAVVEHEQQKSLEIFIVTRDISHWVRNENMLRTQKELTSKLSVTDNLDTALNHVLNALTTLNGIPIAGTFCYNKERGFFQLSHIRNISDVFHESLKIQSVLDRYTRMVLAGDPIYLSRHRAKELYPEVDFPMECNSIGIVPVEYEGEIVASINVCSDQFSMIPEYLCTTLETIASLLGPVLARIEAEEKLQENEQRLRLICESTDDMISLRDLNGKYTYFNGPDRYKAQWSDIVGKDIFDIFPLPTAKLLNEQFEQVVRTQKSLTCEYSIDLRGKKQWYSANIYPIRNAQGQVTSIARISRNITERKKYEQQLQHEHNLLVNITSSLLDHIYVKDQTGKIIFSNQQRHHHNPLKRKVPYVGLTDNDLMPRDEAEYYRHQEQRILSTGMPILDQEQVIDDYSGRKKHLLITKLPLRDDEKRIIGIIGVNRDITELKRAQQQIDQIFNLSMDILCILNLEGNFIRVSPAIERILGYSPAHTVGRKLSDFACPESRKSLEKTLHTFFLSGKPLFNREDRYLCKDGSFRWLSWVAYPCLDEKRVYAVGRDITTLKENAELLRRQEQALYHVGRVVSVGEMASALAHEINQPLCAITTYADTCRRLLEARTAPLEAIEEVLGKIANQSSRAGKVVNSIKNLVRKKDPDKNHHKVTDILMPVLELLDEEMRNLSIETSLDIDDRLDVMHVDLVQLQQVFLNLIRNSIEAMSPEPPESRRLAIHCQRISDRQIQVDIVDSGTGMPPEKANVIFDSFFTTKSQGLGIGLSICKSIIESHGGTIWAQPNTAKGMTFSFTLLTHSEGNIHGQTGNNLCSG